MEIEHDIILLPIDENLQTRLDEIAANGWSPAPGFKPMAIYTVLRVKAATDAMGIRPRMTINDDNVMIMRKDGTLEGADGKQIGKA